MKQPFWILNSSLLLILIAALLFIFFTRIKLPARQPIEPYMVSSEKKPFEKTNLEIIYKNDLFNTNQFAIITPAQPEAATTTKIPTPPSPVEIHIPETPAPEFFDPLPLTLTGLIIQYDESKNKAIIMDNKTQSQINYKIGDEIEDAQIVRILKNKVILIRSNGQQEILYLSQDEAKLDSPIEISATIKNLVKKVSDELYIIDPVRFSNYIGNLGEVIEQFDLITAFKQGKSIGIRIGKLDQDSLGSLMGLMTDDIIEKIEDIPTDTNQNRLEIYKKIISAKEGDIIKVELQRNGAESTISYKLKKIEATKPISTQGITQIEKIQEDKTEANRIKTLREKHKFAPTLEELKLREKQNLFKKKFKPA